MDDLNYQIPAESGPDVITFPFDPARTPREQIESAIASLPPRHCKQHPHVLQPVDKHETVQRVLYSNYDYDQSKRPISFSATFERCSQCPFEKSGHDIEVEHCAVGMLRIGKRDFSTRDETGRPLPRCSGSTPINAGQSARQQFEEWLVSLAEFKCRLSNEGLRIRTCLMEAPFKTWTFEPRFTPCLQCRLERLGITPDDTLASFDNFVVEPAALRLHLKQCRNFAAAPKGVLLLLGNCGTGKTHLAIAILRELLCQGKSGLVFIKHRHFLAQHWHSLRPVAFGQESPKSPLARCQEASLLVYDELTVEPDGSRTCDNILLDLFETRIGHYKPSIITANLSPAELEFALGTRLYDRLRRAAFSVLEFGFESKRAHFNVDYLNRSSRP